MAKGKKIHVMVFGPSGDHQVSDIMDAIAKAAHDGGATSGKSLGAHGDFARPHQSPEDKGGVGAVDGAEILCDENNVEKITALLSQIPNIQVNVAEAA